MERDRLKDDNRSYVILILNILDEDIYGCKK